MATKCLVCGSGNTEDQSKTMGISRKTQNRTHYCFNCGAYFDPLNPRHKSRKKRRT